MKHLLFQIYTTRAGKDILEAQGVHKCWLLLISILLILLFTSRTIYDLVAIKVESAKKFGFGWTFATDMVSLMIGTPTWRAVLDNLLESSREGEWPMLHYWLNLYRVTLSLKVTTTMDTLPTWQSWSFGRSFPPISLSSFSVLEYPQSQW